MTNWTPNQYSPPPIDDYTASWPSCFPSRRPKNELLPSYGGISGGPKKIKQLSLRDCTTNNWSMNFSQTYCMQEGPNRVTVVLGAQWGDEGKGKVVDLLAEHMEVICRFGVL